MTLLISSQLLTTVKEDFAEEPPKSFNTTIYKLLKTVLSEFISTAFLLFFGCMTCMPLEGNHPQPLYSALGFGMVVIFNIQAFGHISEAHMNPCITLIAILWKKMSVILGMFYITAQCVGAIIGYGLLIGVTSSETKTMGVCVTQPHANYTAVQALSTEFILTTALSFLTCAVWGPVNKARQECNSLKFGFTVVGLSLAGGQLTGASMNPARSFGPALWTGRWTGHWIYWLGPLSGSALTALFYKYVWLRTEKVKTLDSPS